MSALLRNVPVWSATQRSFGPKNPEITWSIMHPVKPDLAYLHRVIAAAAEYHVDSFELCGEAHSSFGGVDGAIRFLDYPQAQSRLNLPALDANIALLNTVVEAAHQSGRPIYYWHREVMVPRAVVESVPGLLDEAGEFDLLGAAYHDLLRCKLREFFVNVPAMDGLVLTVTESDYSVIHNSNPKRYPPALVIEKVVTTFAEELQRHGKRFILRSFGSIAQDYEDILAGAERVSAAFPFEIETKITPYDFSPFLALNPFLTRTGAATLSAEYDSIGEFLGAGFLPAADPQRVIECVNYARSRGVDRHVIRVDRIGHATFESTQAIHLLAFDQAIRIPGITADSIWQDWSAAHWPACAPAMTELMKRGIEVVKKTHFIDGHLIFHAFPIDPDLKWIKASGILALWQPGCSLARHQGMWGILTDRVTPSRAALMLEKATAITEADAALAAVRALAGKLSAEEMLKAEQAWHNATHVTRFIHHFCRCVSAYFDDMAAGQENHPTLSRIVAGGTTLFAPFAFPAVQNSGALTRPLSPDQAYGSHEATEDSIAGAYARPLAQIGELLLAEYDAEFAERCLWENVLNHVVDLVLCGTLTDDFRVHRFMHAGHARLRAGRPARAAGNRVFPNGFLECELALPSHGETELVIAGDCTGSSGFALTLNGISQSVRYDSDGTYRHRLPSPAADPTGPHNVLVRIQKSGTDYPWIYGLATVVRDRRLSPPQ